MNSKGLKSTLLEVEDGTTVPEWSTRVRNILEGEDQEPEDISIPEGVYLAPCRICDGTVSGIFSVSSGDEKYQYNCLRCGNLGDVFNTEFNARRAWNMENGGLINVLRNVTNSIYDSRTMMQRCLTQIDTELHNIKVSVETKFDDLVYEISESRKLLQKVTDPYDSSGAAIKINISEGTLSGMLTSDIPETISIVNSSSNEMSRTIELGISDITRAVDRLVTAIGTKQ